MTYQDAQKQLAEIDIPSLDELRSELYEPAIRYAHIRAEWSLMDAQKRKEADADRSRAHDGFIDACHILSRNMQKAGESIRWRSALGEERKMIGDFACYIHCVQSIKSR